jgi:hypothetical protein
MCDQLGGIFSTSGENVYGFAQKVPSASEPKARYFSKIMLVHTRRRKLFRKSKNWKALNWYRIPLLVLILNHQTTICFVLWSSSFVVKSSNL